MWRSGTGRGDCDRRSVPWVPSVERIRVDGYVRVSRVRDREGESFISPALQREAIEAWAKNRRGCELVEVFEELDESGLRTDRPLLELAIRRIEMGLSSGLVVPRVDRFGRSLVDGVQKIQRIEAAGGAFYSVEDGLDSRTDSGKLVLRILLSVAEFYADQYRRNWRSAKLEAVRRGVYTGPDTPVGYRKTRTKRLLPHATAAPVMAEVFRRRVAGEKLSDLCRYLQSEGVLTRNGNRCWSVSTLHKTLKDRVYLGESHWDSYVNRASHPALIDAATWEAAQRPAAVVVARRERPESGLLTGIARCAACRHSLSSCVVYTVTGERFHRYACNRTYAGGRCEAPAYISGLKLEPYIIDVTFGLLARRRRAPIAAVAACELEANDAATALARYRDNERLAARLGEDAFFAGLTVRKERLREANLGVAQARAQVAVHDLPPVAELRAAFSDMSRAEKRALIVRVIDVVFVRKAKGPASNRVTICPAGTAPHDLPRPGCRGNEANRPIKRRRAWINPPA
jgi:site-specific DNA recombinase